MKSRPSFAEHAAKTLAQAAVGSEPSDASSDERIVLAMNAALRLRARRRLHRRVAIGFGAVALAAAVLLASRDGRVATRSLLPSRPCFRLRPTRHPPSHAPSAATSFA